MYEIETKTRSLTASLPIFGREAVSVYRCDMHELAVMAQSIDEMKVNIAWITECFCSGVIVVTSLVDNKLDDFNHELLVVLRTRIFRMTRMSPVGSLACVSCLIYIR